MYFVQSVPILAIYENNTEKIGIAQILAHD